MNRFQDLSRYHTPHDFRGRSRFFIQIWWLVQATIFRSSPQPFYRFRRVVLRMFGARIGDHVLIRPSAQFTYPWNVQLGDYSWVGDRAIFYALAPIVVGAHSVISQDAYLCGATHDFRRIDFPILGKGINIGSQVWVAAGAFIHPGVHLSDGAIVGARAVVARAVSRGVIVSGNPAVVVGGRPEAPAHE